MSLSQSILKAYDIRGIVADERAAVSAKIIKAIKYKGQVFHISALNGLGCKDLIAGSWQYIQYMQ
jgi:GTP-binding protein